MNKVLLGWVILGLYRKGKSSLSVPVNSNKKGR